MSHHMSDYLSSTLADPGLLAVFSKESREMLGQVRPTQLRFLKHLVDAGGLVMIGTDTFPSLIPGFTAVDEIKVFVDAGLSRYQALHAATVSPAMFLGAENELGTIEAGNRADLS